jgi:tRNA modification GTPase
VVRKEDPIYALATPEGVSAISVIRISGISISKKFFSFLGIQNKRPGVFLRNISLNGFTEKCLVLYFKAPQSYTGEDVIEIQPHGSMVVVSEILDVLEGFGFREAQAGEFTKRGFVNNKFTIDEAESVAANIGASSAEELRMLEDFRLGRVGNFFSSVTKKIENLLVTIESQLDFSDEEAVGSMNKDNIKSEVSVLKKGLGDFLEKYSPFQSEMMKKKVVLVGRPNVGKSSLFNLLVEKKVALVSDVPGTTRDVVRKNLFLKGVEVTLEDTAGIRSGKVSKIEKMGMALTEESYKSSDLCLEVFEPEQIIEKKFKDSLIVMNKSDLLKSRAEKNILYVSAKTGDGIEKLRETIYKHVRSKPELSLVTERVYKAVIKANNSIEEVKDDDVFEITAQQLRDALLELRYVYGNFDNEKILDGIFSKFCIGK